MATLLIARRTSLRTRWYPRQHLPHARTRRAPFGSGQEQTSAAQSLQPSAEGLRTVASIFSQDAGILVSLADSQVGMRVDKTAQRVQPLKSTTRAPANFNLRAALSNEPRRRSYDLPFTWRR